MPKNIFLIPFVITAFPCSSGSLNSSAGMVRPAARASAASLYLACLFLYLNQSTIATIKKGSPQQMMSATIATEVGGPLFQSPKSELMSCMAAF